MQPVSAGTDDGLIDGNQLGGLDSERQLGGDQLTPLEPGMQLRIKQGAVLLLPFALRQRSLGMTEQPLGIACPPLGQPEKHRDLDAVIFHLIMLHQLLLQMLAPPLQWLIEVRQQQAEVIGSDPTEQGTRRHQLLQPLGYLAQQAVGNPDPEAIVDFTKMVQVDEYQRGTAPPRWRLVCKNRESLSSPVRLS